MAAMQEYLEKEMAPYYQSLKQKIEEYNNCKDLKAAGEYEVRRSKTLYRRLAKLIHPDINPETVQRDELKELWQRIVTAYNFNDIKELTELEVLVRKALNQTNSGDKKIHIPDIEERILVVHKEIKDIIHNEPYNYKSLIEDEQAIEKKKAALQEELVNYKKYHEELDEIISQILSEGGIKLRWLMN
ncbi:MAG: hypothetical protein IJH71_11305 [Eubacterium sp.]|nr:hypothetical protein [Eubacterium sp.]